MQHRKRVRGVGVILRDLDLQYNEKLYVKTSPMRNTTICSSQKLKKTSFVLTSYVKRHENQLQYSATGHPQDGVGLDSTTSLAAFEDLIYTESQKCNLMYHFSKNKKSSSGPSPLSRFRVVRHLANSFSETAGKELFEVHIKNMIKLINKLIYYSYYSHVRPLATKWLHRTVCLHHRAGFGTRGSRVPASSLHKVPTDING
ncbi:hypothetical protein EVAR_55972_1 [Eumeta japonica]|uniref:Uncharacterized protein n=1 Tax=Eumeta variegata TaxID=151549 RepID=A0A4C1YVH6_EUMVA|nr:hypothetical protein EVAR_55972_1 [Eumeta japonica]